MLPIEIDVEPPMLMKGQKWYHVPPRPAGLHRSGSASRSSRRNISTATESTVLAARKLTRALRARFAEKGV